jgi:hypothetical protein
MSEFLKRSHRPKNTHFFAFFALKIDDLFQPLPQRTPFSEIENSGRKLTPVGGCPNQVATHEVFAMTCLGWFIETVRPHSPSLHSPSGFAWYKAVLSHFRPFDPPINSRQPFQESPAPCPSQLSLPQPSLPRSRLSASAKISVDLGRAREYFQRTPLEALEASW